MRVAEPLTGLLEREAELAALDGALAAALAGSGRAVVIEGEAGIGKTCLLTAAAVRARDAGMEVLSARAGELERDLAWGVVRELFDPTLARASGQARNELLSEAAAPAAAVLGLSNEGLLRSGADATAATLRGLYWLTANLAEHRPLLLAVDDAHWSDPPSLRWLAYLGARIEDMPILLAITVRPPQAGAGSDLISALNAHPWARVLHPPALSEQASEQVVRGELGQADPEFAAACHAATRGNPFLLHELVADLARDGVVPSAARAPLVLQLKPEAVARSVLIRLMRVSPDARELASAVAVLGARARLDHAAELAGLDEESAARAADALAASSILVAGAPLEFCHPIVRAAIYADLPAFRRSQWHARTARLLADAGAPPDEVAVHLLVVEPRGNRGVVDTLRAAAKGALARGAAQVAVTYLRRALSEPVALEERADLLRAVGSAEARLGDPQAIEHLREAHELAADPRARAMVARELAVALSASLRAAEAVEILEGAIAAVAEVDPDVALALEAELAAIGQLDVHTARRVLERARGFAGRVEGRTSAERLLLAQLAGRLAIAGESPGQAEDLARRALADGRLLAEQTADSPSFYQAVYVLLLADRFDEAEGLLGQALEDARTRGSALGFAVASFMRSNLAYRRGAVADAEAEARSSIDALDAPLPTALAHLIDALVERGELEAAHEALRASPFAGGLPDNMLFHPLLLSRGRLLVAEGRLREGLAELTELGRRHERLGGRNPAADPWRQTAAVALVSLGEHEEARQLAREAVALARAWGAPRALGLSLRAQGLVEGGKEGIRLLREAVSVLEGSAAQLEHARALVETGAALRRAAQRREAREPLRLGLDLAHRCSASALAERARVELLATGARPRHIVLSGADSLTPSERRIAAMAARGLTNRDIAQALFVTKRTVETHLSHVYQKLEIRSRAELPGALEPGAAPDPRNVI